MAKYELGTRVRHTQVPGLDTGQIVKIDQNRPLGNVLYLVQWPEHAAIWSQEFYLTAVEEEMRLFKKGDRVFWPQHGYGTVAHYTTNPDMLYVELDSGSLASVRETNLMKQEETKMKGIYDDVNYSTVILLIGDDIAEAVRVSYEPNDSNKSPKEYIFKALKRDALQVEDFVAVQTDTRWGLTVCKVTETNCEIDFESNLQLKWIVAKVDTAGFEEIQQKEEDAIRALKQDAAAEKKKTMQDRVRSVLGERVKSLPIYTLKADDAGGEDMPSAEE